MNVQMLNQCAHSAQNLPPAVVLAAVSVAHRAAASVVAAVAQAVVVALVAAAEAVAVLVAVAGNLRFR